MTWKTHALFGICSLWLMAPIPGAVTSSNVAVLFAFAAFGALLPDIDASESKVKHLQIAGIKPFAILSVPLHRSLGHRGLLHSLLGFEIVAGGLAIFSLMLLPIVSRSLIWQPAVALLLGYLSHLAADACTRSGIPLLYPDLKRYFVLPRPLRIVTGSFAEFALLPSLLLLASLLLVTHLPFT